MGTGRRRDEEAVRRFVEQLAITLNDMGFPRMAGRVLGAISVADEPGLTAGEISERLGVSLAAVSSSMRYLLQLGMVVREPVPNSRSDIYRMPDGVLAKSGVEGLYQRLADVIHEGYLAVGDENSPSAHRLGDLRDFLQFIEEEMGKVVEKWEAQTQERMRRRAAPEATV